MLIYRMDVQCNIDVKIELDDSDREGDDKFSGWEANETNGTQMESNGATDPNNEADNSNHERSNVDSVIANGIDIDVKFMMIVLSSVSVGISATVQLSIECTTPCLQMTECILMPHSTIKREYNSYNSFEIQRAVIEFRKWFRMVLIGVAAIISETNISCTIWLARLTMEILQ